MGKIEASTYLIIKQLKRTIILRVVRRCYPLFMLIGQFRLIIHISSLMAWVIQKNSIYLLRD